MEYFMKTYLLKIATTKVSFLGFLKSLCNLSCVYVIIFKLYYDKNYQEWSVGSGSVITNVLASADTRNRSDLPALPEYRRTWDESDIVRFVPEGDVLAIMTNSVITPEQKLDECPEDINVIGAYCTPTNSTTCAKGTRLSTGNGIMTGRCVNSNGELCNNQTNGICTCEVSGWCPVVHKFARQNVNDNRTDNDLLNGCIYDSQLSPLCPVFTIGYILQQANITNFTKIAVEGGLIRMSIQWHCDFDKGHGHECPPPNYQFEQLNAFSVNRLLPFWDLRDISQYHDSNGTLRRDMNRITGIFILFDFDAKAGKFNLFRTVTALAAIFVLTNVVKGYLQKFAFVLKLCSLLTMETTTGGTGEGDVDAEQEEGRDNTEVEHLNVSGELEEKWIELVKQWKKSVNSCMPAAGCSFCCCSGSAWIGITGLLIMFGGAIYVTINAVRTESVLWDWGALIVDTLFIVASFVIALLFVFLRVNSRTIAAFVGSFPLILVCTVPIVAVFLFIQVALMFWFNIFEEFTVWEVLIRMALMIFVNVFAGFGIINILVYFASYTIIFLYCFLRVVSGKCNCSCDCCGTKWYNFSRNMSNIGETISAIRRMP